jgi:hypothetical protein
VARGSAPLDSTAEAVADCAYAAGSDTPENPNMNTSQATVDRLSTTLARRLVFASLLVAGACACDKAKSSYEQCMAHEAKWEFVKARDACRAAVKADPESKSGKAAQAKLAYLEAEAEKALFQKLKESGHCKSGKWVTRCMWKGKPRPTRIEAESKAACNQEAASSSVIGMTCPDCVCEDYWEEPYDEEE